MHAKRFIFILFGVALLLTVLACGGGKDEPVPTPAVATEAKSGQPSKSEATEIPVSTPTPTPAPTKTPYPTNTPGPAPTNTPEPTATPVPPATRVPTETPLPTPTIYPIPTLSPISMVLETVSPELLDCVKTALGDDEYNAIIGGQQAVTPQQIGTVMPCLMQYPQDTKAAIDMFGLDMGSIMGLGVRTPTPTTKPSTPVPTNTATPTTILTPAPTRTPTFVVSEITGPRLETLTVDVGTTVKWVLSAGNPHTVTSGTADDYYAYPDGKWDSGTLSRGKSFSFVFNELGTFPYYCKIHPSMEGVINVIGDK